ncbi:MAG: hypothetical protein NC925_03110 [Candidatus Omnitrophica bacterium]|nr:hypothetical protein [Candidatus Omnitrophota bacterium]MCM8831607.1 hypothetical protein [Candidatus Omnitrophota bacterium]
MVKRRVFYFILNLTLTYFIFQLISKIILFIFKFLLKDISLPRETYYKKKTTNFKYFDAKDIIDAEFKEIR